MWSRHHLLDVVDHVLCREHRLPLLCQPGHRVLVAGTGGGDHDLHLDVGQEAGHRHVVDDVDLALATGHQLGRTDHGHAHLGVRGVVAPGLAGLGRGHHPILAVGLLAQPLGLLGRGDDALLAEVGPDRRADRVGHALDAVGLGLSEERLLLVEGGVLGEHGVTHRGEEPGHQELVVGLVLGLGVGRIHALAHLGLQAEVEPGATQSGAVHRVPVTLDGTALHGPDHALRVGQDLSILPGLVSGPTGLDTGVALIEGLEEALDLALCGEADDLAIDLGPQIEAMRTHEDGLVVERDALDRRATDDRQRDGVRHDDLLIMPIQAGRVAPWFGSISP